MKKHLLWIASAAIIFASCSEDPGDNFGKGTLRIGASIDTGIDLIQTRGTQPDVSTFTFTLQKEGAAAEITTIPEDGIIENLDAGKYTATLTSHPDGFTAAFGEPAYSCSKEVAVYAGATANATLKCTQSNAGIYFIYDESLASVGGFNDISVAVTCGGETLSYAGATKESWGYFTPGKATVSLKDGEDSINIGGKESQEITLEAGQLWEVTLKVTAANESGKAVLSADVVLR